MINIFEISSCNKLKNFDKNLLLKQHGIYLYVGIRKYRISREKKYIQLKRYKGLFEDVIYIPPVLKCRFLENEEEGMEITFRVSWLHLFGEISSIIIFLLLFFLSCIMLSYGNEIIDCIIVLLSGLLFVLLSNLYLHFFYEKEKQIAIEDLKSLVL